MAKVTSSFKRNLYLGFDEKIRRKEQYNLQAHD